MAETSIWKSLALFIFFFSLIIISEISRDEKPDPAKIF